MKKIIVFFLLCSFSIHFVHAQVGEALDEATTYIKRFFKEEKPKIRIYEYTPITPKYEVFHPPVTAESRTAEKYSGSKIIRNGELVDVQKALKENWVEEKDGELRAVSENTKIASLGRTEIRTYRSYFGLNINETIYDIGKPFLDRYDEALVKRVKDYQLKNHLHPDGVIQGKTESDLIRDIYTSQLIKQQYLKKNYTAEERINAVMAFQGTNNLPATGVFDGQTAKKMNQYCFDSGYYDMYSNNIELDWNNGSKKVTLGPVIFFNDGFRELGWGKKEYTNAELALILLKFQEETKLPKTATFDKNTARLLYKYEEIDKLVPKEYKSGNKKFRDFKKEYFIDIQRENQLTETGELDPATESILLDKIYKSHLSDLRNKMPEIHDDFVSVPLSNDYGHQEVKFYFNDPDYDYFILDNERITEVRKLFGYKINRLTDEISAMSIEDIMKSYDLRTREIAIANSDAQTIISVGLIDQNNNLNIQVGATQLSSNRPELERFINESIPIPGLYEAIEGSKGKPIIIIRPDFSATTRVEENTYSCVMGSTFSAVNCTKFTAALNKSCGEIAPVFLASDLKGALAKLQAVKKDNLDPLFQIYVPNKAFFKESYGWKMDDYHIAANLRARGVQENQFHKLPVDENVLIQDWHTHKGPKMFIGHKNESFKDFLFYRVETNDPAPAFVVSCYLPGDEYFVSQWIHKNHMSNVIYFSEKIHPTAVTDVLIEYSRLSALPVNKHKSFNEIWRSAIEHTRKKFDHRYSNQMKLELDKLYNIIFQLTFDSDKKPHYDA